MSDEIGLERTLAPSGALPIASLQLDADSVFRRAQRRDATRARACGAQGAVARERPKGQVPEPSARRAGTTPTSRSTRRSGRPPAAAGHVVSPEDLRRKVRGHRSPYAVCFVLDNSWSIHAERMVEKAKGIVFRLLEDATARGDRVALVAFRGGLPEATVALPLTSSMALAYRRLKAVPLSGQTPLADALHRGRRAAPPGAQQASERRAAARSRHRRAADASPASRWRSVGRRSRRSEGAAPCARARDRSRHLSRRRARARRGPRGRRRRVLHSCGVALARHPPRRARPDRMTDELRDRTMAWASLSITQGEVLDAFAAYCDELDDLTVVERTPVAPRARLARERAERDRAGPGDPRGAPGSRSS